MQTYTKAIAHSKSDRSIDGKRKKLLKTIDQAITKITKANDFGDDDYKIKVLRHLTFNNNFESRLCKIIDIKAVAEQSYDAMEVYVLAQEISNQKMEESQQQYEKDFYAYAATHHIEIIESETDLGRKMKISNEVFEYYHDLYLTYFKVYINETYLMDAIEKSDVSAIQRNANALVTATKEGLEVLETKPLYKKDQSIINATKKAFDFFIDDGENQIPTITEFLILNEDFDKIKINLEQTAERKRTKEQIDNYNKKVQDVNKSADNYNKINKKLNINRQKTINGLNNINANFLSKHIPTH